MFKKVLTDPSNHNPDNFIYLVHGLLDWTGNGITPQEMKYKVGRVKDPNQFYRTSMIAHLDGESARQRIGWYGGEIYQVGTFADIGIIVNPADDGLVYIAFPGDLMNPMNPEKLKTFAVQHKGEVSSPLILLTQLSNDYIKYDYNELIIKGYSRTDIQAVFYRGRYSKTEHEVKTLGEIVSEIMGREVPAINLPPPKIEIVKKG